MKLTIHADQTNEQNIPSLLDKMGYSIPCNCHGAHHCNGKRYSFDCSFIPKESITIEWEQSEQPMHGISLESLPIEDGLFDTLLLDIGTTTLAFALISRKTKKLHQCSTIENPQRKFGNDVVSRIRSACEGNSDTLQHLLIDAIENETKRLCSKNNQTTSDISKCYIGGNTAMIHLLLGYPCDSLAKSPFRIKESLPQPFLFSQCEINISPWISPFVGGDIYAGLLTPKLYQNKETFLFVDLGTNGELVLSHQGKYYVTSTAAGPAFEAGNLTCGCAGIPGAIQKVILRKLQPKLTTINNRLPIGICGSGAISLCAELVRKQYITNEGILTNLFPEEGIFLANAADGSRIIFTVDDLRNVQLAIAAIAAGIDTLLYEANVHPADVSTLYLGGGFGFHLEKEDCKILGIFSALHCDTLSVLGNSCLQGLFHCCTENLSFANSNRFSSISLADNEYFQQQFIEHMCFRND